MCNADSGVVLLEQLAQSLVDKCLGLRVQSTCRLIKDEDVRLLDKGSRDGNALLLPTRELRASRTNVCFETVRLRFVSIICTI